MNNVYNVFNTQSRNLIVYVIVNTNITFYSNS